MKARGAPSDGMEPALGAEAVRLFGERLSKALGFLFDDGKQDFLAGVLRERMRDLGCSDAESYFDLMGSRREFLRLAEALTVTETFFLRYEDHFRALAEAAVPELLAARAKERSIRLLSAGCASGEEAYSLAIVLRERFPELESWEVRILGADVNLAMLEKASRGRYGAWSLRGAPAGFRDRYFKASGKEFVLDEAVRSRVSFRELNLVGEGPLPWPGPFDVIFCRNVIMYFTPEAMRSAVSRLGGSLSPGGFLFLGHAETLRGISRDFRLRQACGSFFYQKKDPAAAGEGLGEAPHLEEARPAAASPEATRALLDPPGEAPWVEAIRRASERIGGLGAEAAPRPRAPGAQGPAPPPWGLGPAMDLLRQEKFQAALEALQGLPPGSESDRDAQLLRAALLTNCGRMEEAEEACLRILSSDDMVAGAHYLLALCREHAGDRKIAAEHDRTAAYLDSGFAMPAFHLGLMARRSGDKEAARRHFERALSLLAREDPARILLFGGGFRREALSRLCLDELRACGGPS